MQTRSLVTIYNFQPGRRESKKQRKKINLVNKIPIGTQTKKLLNTKTRQR